MRQLVQNKIGIEPAILVEIYRQMSRIRAVDKAIQAGLSSGKFLFSYWPMTGQESIPATLAQLIGVRDYMVTTYRGIHDQVAKGVPLEGLFAEALGRIDGVNKGKGGSPHISHPSSGSMLTTAIVGGGAPIANGLALAAQMRGEDRITVVNFGDGATSIGAVHEAMNLAGVWKLPVIFLCQNNQIGEYTPIPGYTASKDFASRAAGYGFKGVLLDANDVPALYQGMKTVVEETRRGQGPIFVESEKFPQLTLCWTPHRRRRTPAPRHPRFAGLRARLGSMYVRHMSWSKIIAGRLLTISISQNSNSAWSCRKSSMISTRSSSLISTSRSMKPSFVLYLTGCASRVSIAPLMIAGEGHASHLCAWLRKDQRSRILWS